LHERSSGDHDSGAQLAGLVDRRSSILEGIAVADVGEEHQNFGRKRQDNTAALI
jgi:hypothetical protein